MRTAVRILATLVLITSTRRCDPLLGQAASAWPPDLLRADHAAAKQSMSRGLADALAPILEDDAVLLYPGAPILHTRASILEMLRSQPLVGSRIQWDPVFAEVSNDGSFAVMYGTTMAAPTDSGAAVGRFESAWRKMGDGSWRLTALCLTGAPSARVIVVTLPWRTLAGERLPALARVNAFVRADYDFAAHASQSSIGAAFETYASADAVMAGSPFHPYVRGPQAIRQSLDTPGGSHARWTWWPVLALGDSSGGVGVTIGEAEIRDSVAGHEQIDLTEYMTLWRRLPDGRIRFVADAGNARPPLNP